MGDLIDFVNNYGNLDFDTLAFNEVDAAILVELTYLPFDRLFDLSDPFQFKFTLGQLAQLYQPYQNFFMHYDRQMTNSFRHQLLERVATSYRYSNLRVGGFLNQVDLQLQTQSAYLFFELQPGHLFIAFRGTDDLIVGWKEDLVLTYQSVIPAYLYAKDYLRKLAQFSTHGQWTLAGHSKGGHLALYTASQLDKEQQARIKAIYSFDSPGFHTVNLNTTTMQALTDRHRRYIVEDSIIGQLLFHQKPPIILKARKRGFRQHQLVNWVVQDDHFLRCPTTTLSSQILQQINSEWMLSYPPSRRREIIQTINHLIDQSGAITLHQLIEEPHYYLNKINKAFLALPSHKQEVLRHFARQYVHLFRHDLRLFRYDQFNRSLQEAHQRFKKIIHFIYQTIGNY